MVNTAEKVHRIRRRREYLQEVGHYQPGGFEDTLVKLKAAGVSAKELRRCCIVYGLSQYLLPIRPSQRGAPCCAKSRISCATWLNC